MTVNLFKMAYNDLNNEILTAKATLEAANDRMALLLNDCPHTELVPKSYYFSGSYTDQSYTDKWDECVCCGKRFNETTRTHNYYG